MRLLQFGIGMQNRLRVDGNSLKIMMLCVFSDSNRKCEGAALCDSSSSLMYKKKIFKKKLLQKDDYWVNFTNSIAYILGKLEIQQSSKKHERK